MSCRTLEQEFFKIQNQIEKLRIENVNNPEIAQLRKLRHLILIRLSK